MTDLHQGMNQLLTELIELLDIPQSHYERATDRYHSLGDWLHRTQSTLLEWNPSVYAQGSFRYGTVIRPLSARDEYDLDLVCQLVQSKRKVSQKTVKERLGNEIKVYAEAHNFNEPAQEKHRCWRLNYSDDVSFHMDILPSIPEDTSVIQSLIEHDVQPEFAVRAVAITDDRVANYSVITEQWPSSNPAGLGDWFENQMRLAAQGRIRELLEQRIYASIADVPAYEWKTPLQRTIQILKRHRDVMFDSDRTWAPISMIITTLAARAYDGEANLFDAMSNIVEKMPQLIRSSTPRIPNPVNPLEDFADCWAVRGSQHERYFRLWHAQLQADMETLAKYLSTSELEQYATATFKLRLRADQVQRVRAASGVSIVRRTAAPVVPIIAPARPWGNHDHI